MSAMRATCWLSGPAAGALIFNCGASAAGFATRSGGGSLSVTSCPRIRNTGRPGGGGDDTYIWLFPGPPVREQQLVAADALKLGAAERRQGEAAIRKAARHFGLRPRA